MTVFRLLLTTLTLALAGPHVMPAASEQPRNPFANHEIRFTYSPLPACGAGSSHVPLAEAEALAAIRGAFADAGIELRADQQIDRPDLSLNSAQTQ